MIMLAEVYTPEEDPLAVLARRDRGAISVYARGRDYHDVVKKRLKRLGRLAGGGDRGGDQGLRRHRAGDGEAAGAAAGIGWQGKHTNLLSRELGNWFFLGAIFTDAGAAAGRAGGGSLRVVPGLPRRLPDRGVAGAVPARCAAVHQLPDDRARRAGGRRSCGRCSATGSTAATTAWRPARGTSSRRGRGRRRYGRGRSWRRRGWRTLAALDDAGFRALFSGSPIKRIGRNRFVRNVLYAIGNSGDAGLRPVARGGWRRMPIRWCGTRRPGRWGGSVEALQVGAGERRRAGRRGARGSGGARAAAARRGVAGLGERGAGLEQRLGEVGREARARCSASASAAAGSPCVAERGGEERVGEGVVGLGGEGGVERGARRPASRRRRRRRGRRGAGGRRRRASSAVGRGEGGARRGRAGRRRATGRRRRRG